MSVTAAANTTNTTATNTTATNTTATNNSKNALTTSTQKILGKDDFLKLLISQLKNQDPLEPVKDQDFIAQMASFSSLEQMNNLNTAFTDLNSFFKENMQSSMLLQQAGSMLGSVVEYTIADGTTKTGLVSSVRMDKGTPVLMVNGEKVDMSTITSISMPTVYQSSTNTDTSDSKGSSSGDTSESAA
ncbi:MAG: flagellar hook assembly protein FlgD [Acidobacteriota bacterium]